MSVKQRMCWVKELPTHIVIFLLASLVFWGLPNHFPLLATCLLESTGCPEDFPHLCISSWTLQQITCSLGLCLSFALLVPKTLRSNKFAIAPSVDLKHWGLTTPLLNRQNIIFWQNAKLRQTLWTGISLEFLLCGIARLVFPLKYFFSIRLQFPKSNILGTCPIESATQVNYQPTPLKNSGSTPKKQIWLTKTTRQRICKSEVHKFNTFQMGENCYELNSYPNISIFNIW